MRPRTGRAQLHVRQYSLVQWAQALASETPGFITVLLIALKLQSAAALGALISQINRWTRPAGVLPLVFAVSTGSLSDRPTDPVQREELLLTAAQSMFTVALVVTGRLTRTWVLLGLFTVQFVAAWTSPTDLAGRVRLNIAPVYLVLGVGLLVVRHRHLVRVLRSGPRPQRSAAKIDRVDNRAGGAR